MVEGEGSCGMGQGEAAAGWDKEREGGTTTQSRQSTVQTAAW